MNTEKGGNVNSKFSPVWFIIFIILLLKSIVVLISIYKFSYAILVYSSCIFMPLIFLISFSFLFSSRNKLLYLFGLDLFTSILFIIDIIYVRAYGHLISIYMMFAKDVTKDLSASIISLVRCTDFLMLIDLPFLFILSLKSKYRERVSNKKILFVFTLIFSIFGICFQFNKLENNKVLGNYRMQALFMSPIGYHMYDLYRFIYDKTDTLSNKDINEINTWLEENEKYQKPDSKYIKLKGLIKGKNIIAIQVESLENILIGQNYYGQEITPNINKLLSSSIYFNNIHEQVKDGNSSDAELLTLTSTYPISSGSAFLRFGGNNYVTLPKLLKEQGYTSIAIHGDEKEFWNRNNVYPALGFEKFVSEENFEDKTSVGMGITDKSLFTQSISEIKKLKNPYNVFLITLTSHMPFDINKDMQYLNIPEDGETSKYLQSIHYTDKVFGDFYNSLKTDGLLDNTIIIIYGDHEGIHKYYKTTLPDNNYEIPFIVYVPGMKGFKVNKIGGQVDIMPTLAYLLGIDEKKYASSVMGRNLFNSASGEVILPNGVVLGEANDTGHLSNAQSIADLIIKGNYFAAKECQK